MSDFFERALAVRVRRLTGDPAPLPVGAVPEWLRARVRDALVAGETHYTDRPGILELRRALVLPFSALGMERGADEVVVTSGEKEALFVSLLALDLEPGDVAVAFDRCAHRDLFELFGLRRRSDSVQSPPRLRYAEIVDDAPAPAWSSLERPLIVNLRDGILRELPRRLAEDDPIVIGNLDALPGLESFRVGFVCAPAHLAKRVRSWKQTLSICTASPSQRAAYEAWREAKGVER
jgi:DNA-binding transcriptional MocR family regulator